YPGHARSITRAPRPRAISRVRSFEPESMTTTSSQNRTLSRQAPMFASSLTQMMTAESFGKGGLAAEGLQRREHLAGVLEAARLLAVHGAREARREAARAGLPDD